MPTKISKEKIIEIFKTGCKHLGNFAVDIYGTSLNIVGENAFSDAIEIGVENTIAALYDANVSDDEIIRVINEHWGINKQETIERLAYEKKNAAIRSLKQYLKLQGYSDKDVADLFLKNNITFKIKHHKDWWKLKNNPEKLFKEINKTIFD